MLRNTTQGNCRTIHISINSPEVGKDFRKEFVPLRYRRLGEYRGRRRHISPRPVRGICELQPVKGLLEGRLSTGYPGKQTLGVGEVVERSVLLHIQSSSRTVQGGGKSTPCKPNLDGLHQTYSPPSHMASSNNQKGGLRHQGRPLAGRSPSRVKRLQLVDYMSTLMESRKCMKCTISYGSTPTNVTCSRP